MMGMGWRGHTKDLEFPSASLVVAINASVGAGLVPCNGQDIDALAAQDPAAFATSREVSLPRFCPGGGSNFHHMLLALRGNTVLTVLLYRLVDIHRSFYLLLQLSFHQAEHSRAVLPYIWRQQDIFKVDLRSGRTRGGLVHHHVHPPRRSMPTRQQVLEAGPRGNMHR